MRSISRYLFGLLAGVVLLMQTACDERPTDVLSNGEMEALLYDYHIAKALADDEPASTRYRGNAYVESALEKHHVTEVQFDSTLAWYTRNPKEMEKVYRNVIKRLETSKSILDRQVTISGGNASLNTQGDSVNIWNGASMVALSGLPYDNRIAFAYDNSGQQFQDRDTLRFSARFRYLPEDNMPSSANAPVMSLSIRYRNDSIISRLYNVLRGGEQTITLYDDTLGRIRQVSGFIYLPPQESNRILLLDNISLVRLHAQDVVQVIN